VINSIQHAVGAALDFQSIVDVVADKLREVFATGDMSIRWWDEATGTVHYLYACEHGVRLSPFKRTPEPGSVQYRFYREDPRPALFGSVKEQLDRGVPVRPGTDRARSLLIVPMLAGDRVLGAIGLENHERDNAFGRPTCACWRPWPAAWAWRCSTPAATKPSGSAPPSSPSSAPCRTRSPASSSCSGCTTRSATA
jgi:GAF domain-containing protein